MSLDLTEVLGYMESEYVLTFDNDSFGVGSVKVTVSEMSITRNSNGTADADVEFQMTGGVLFAPVRINARAAYMIHGSRGYMTWDWDCCYAVDAHGTPLGEDDRVPFNVTRAD